MPECGDCKHCPEECRNKEDIIMFVCSVLGVHRTTISDICEHFEEVK